MSGVILVRAALMVRSPFGLLFQNMTPAVSAVTARIVTNALTMIRSQYGVRSERLESWLEW